MWDEAFTINMRHNIFWKIKSKKIIAPYLRSPWRHTSQKLWPQLLICTGSRIGRRHTGQRHRLRGLSTNATSKPGIFSSSFQLGKLTENPNNTSRWSLRQREKKIHSRMLCSLSHSPLRDSPRAISALPSNCRLLSDMLLTPAGAHAYFENETIFPVTWCSFPYATGDASRRSDNKRLRVTYLVNTDAW